MFIRLKIFECLKIVYFLSTKLLILKIHIMKACGVWGFSQLGICRPSLLLSFDPILWMIRNVLNRMKNEIHFFCDIYFSSYRENSSKIGMDFLMTITRKIKKSAFFFIQPIPDLLCKFDQLWQKKWFCCFMIPRP